MSSKHKPLTPGFSLTFVSKFPNIIIIFLFSTNRRSILLCYRNMCNEKKKNNSSIGSFHNIYIILIDIFDNGSFSPDQSLLITFWDVNGCLAYHAQAAGLWYNGCNKNVRLSKMMKNNHKNISFLNGLYFDDFNLTHLCLLLDIKMVFHLF